LFGLASSSWGCHPTGCHPLQLQIPLQRSISQVLVNLSPPALDQKKGTFTVPPRNALLRAKNQSEAKLPSLFGGGFRTKRSWSALFVLVSSLVGVRFSARSHAGFCGSSADITMVLVSLTMIRWLLRRAAPSSGLVALMGQWLMGRTGAAESPVGCCHHRCRQLETGSKRPGGIQLAMTSTFPHCPSLLVLHVLCLFAAHAN